MSNSDTRVKKAFNACMKLDEKSELPQFIQIYKKENLNYQESLKVTGMIARKRGRAVMSF